MTQEHRGFAAWMPLERLARSIRKRIAIWRDEPMPLHTPDREFLEQRIFPFLNARAAAGQKLLFIGVAAYTRHYYPQLRYDVHTIDFNRRAKKYGHAGRHVVGSATELTRFYGREFDVIVANGLIGYGLDDREGFRRLLQMCHACLREGGVLILGYNDNASHLDFAVRDVEEYRGFVEFVPAIDLVTAATIKVNPANDHTFVFLKRGPLR
ncbi:MAG: hypothetical protein RL603_2022 [Pseudomonadota bacterium]